MRSVASRRSRRGSQMILLFVAALTLFAFLGLGGNFAAITNENTIFGVTEDKGSRAQDRIGEQRDSSAVEKEHERDGSGVVSQRGEHSSSSGKEVKLKDEVLLVHSDEEDQVIPPIVIPKAGALPPSSAHYANGAANRSPPRLGASAVQSITRAQHDNEPNRNSNKASFDTVESWSLAGQMQRTPAWGPILLSLIQQSASVQNTAPAAAAIGEASGESASEVKETGLDRFVLLLDDPWLVLVGWIPSRFMGPQKVGKKANGDIMIPPTKGRDIAVYHKEYNASWHAKFESGGFEYHFQIMHRNSLAVCIRERLHIHALHMRPRPREEEASGGPHEKEGEGGSQSMMAWRQRPILVYHCPCRHCNEHTSEVPTGQQTLSQTFPDYVSPSVSAGGAVMHPSHRVNMKKTDTKSGPPVENAPADGRNTFFSDGDGLRPALPLKLDVSLYPRVDVSGANMEKNTITCLEPLSAPWLVTQKIVPRFAYEGHYQNLDELLRVQSDVNGAVMVVMFNKFWIDHLHNFIFSLTHRADFFNFIVATIDVEALALCVASRLPCFDAVALAEFEEDSVDVPVGVGSVGGAVDSGVDASVSVFSTNDGNNLLLQKGARRKVTEAMSWVKPRLALAVLERGYHFIMSDLDMSFNFNPIRDLAEIGFDIAHQCDAKDKYSINSGFYLARSNPRTIRFFHNLMLFTPQENSDQTAMKLFARYDHTHSASNGCLDRRSFNMKCYYKIDKTVRRNEQGEETFEWRQFETDRSKFTWKMLHATCLNGAIPKIQFLRTVNAWFLDDLDQYTRVGGGAANIIAREGVNGERGLKTKKERPLESANSNNSYCVWAPAAASSTSGSTDVNAALSRSRETEGRARHSQSRKIQTRHGATYTESTDPIYLEKRH